MALKFLWIAKLLSFLVGFKKLFLWIGLAIPAISHVFGWVQRIWSSARTTTLGRLMRMAGLLSVCAALSIGVTHTIFTWVTWIIAPSPMSFQWPTNPLIHSMFGAMDTLISLNLVLSLVFTWVYFSIFLLTVRLAKYILSLTVG